MPAGFCTRMMRFALCLHRYGVSADDFGDSAVAEIVSIQYDRGCCAAARQLGRVQGLQPNHLVGLPSMKTSIQIASSIVALLTVLSSNAVLAEVDNCGSFFPKVPYNCELVRIDSAPAERADFSAFEIRPAKTANRKDQPMLRSVTRDMAKKLRAQGKTIVN